MNGVSVCLEEIALEGLDGITISTLWRRINSTTVWSTTDETYKEFLWRSVASCQDIQTYVLEEPRGEILDFVDDSETYPYCCISESGVRGSCSTFNTRKLINVSNLSLQTVVQRYGNKLVLVASQLLRNKVLLGPDFDASVKIVDQNYCLLEMIGRGRKLGRLHCHLGLQTSVDSRSLFSQVKTLVKLQLVTKQAVYLKNRLATTSIIYLARYHTDHGNDSLQFKISEALSETPECCLSLKALCLKLKEKQEVVERVVNDLSKSGHVQYIYLKDSGTISGDSSVDLIDVEESAESGECKIIKFLHYFYKVCAEGDNEVVDEEWTQPDYQELSMSIPAEVPIMHSIYQFVESKGKDGASLTQCCEELSMPFFQTRRILKDLETLQVLFCKFEELGNTSKNQYFARHALIQSQRNAHVSQSSKPTASQITQDSAPQIAQPPTQQTTQAPCPATQLPTSQTTQPNAIQIIQPAMQANQLTKSQITETAPIQVSQITQDPATQVTQLAATQITHSSATLITPSPATWTTPPSSTQITKPQISLVTHPSTSHPSQNSLIPTGEAELVVVHNPETTVEEDTIMDNTPQLPANTCDINSTSEQRQKPVSSRSEKVFNTERFLRRKEIILNVLKNLKVVEGRILFQRMIRMEERKMGLGVNVDRRSVLYVLDKLTADGLLNRLEINVKVEDEEHKVTLFCDKSIQQHNEEIVSCINRFRDRIVVQKAKRNGVLVNNVTIPNSGFLPKMPRCELLHIFLFYVIHELSNPNVDLETWQQKYVWAKHLRPEHTPRKLGRGWFTPYSILLLLPVSLYSKLVGSSYQNNIVKQYIDNPATKHMLLKDLPPLARQMLVERKKDTFLFGNLEFLASFGLITPTSKLAFIHPLDIACYLHTSTVLKDTRDAEPAYDDAKHPEGKDFPEKMFSFSGLADVEQYWITLRLYCMSTPLNRKRQTTCSTKKSRFKSDLESLIVDDKEIPICSRPRGDGVGAAGLDSRLYCHLQSKWLLSIKEKLEIDSDVEDSLDWQLCFTNDDDLSKTIAVAKEQKKRKRKREESVQDKAAKKKRKVVNTDEKKTDVNPKDVECSSTQHKIPSNLQKNVNKVKKKRKKRKRIRKKVDSKPKAKPDKPKGHWSKYIHDQRDADALKQMQAKRNTFTPQQQKLLFICCLALRIIGKKSTDTGYSDWLWTRDILYKDHYESAKTKTALSISRKYRSMMGNTQTKTNLDICVADCMQEKEFQPYCNIRKSCTEVMFNELVDLLKKKYTMEDMVSNPLILPSTMDEFEQQKSLYSSLEVENPNRCDEEILSLEPRETSVADVRQRIIRDSIVSALLLRNIDYGPRVAFTFLSQFTEEELIIAISVLKNRRIIVRKALRYTKGYDLASCAFSQMLSSVGYRTIENHFSFSVMEDAKSFYEQIKSKSVSLDNDENSKQSLTLKFSESSILGGQAYCVFALLTCQRLAVNMEVPENFLSLEKNQNPELVSENPNEEDRQEINNEALEREESSSLTVANCQTHKISDDKTSKEICQERGFESDICENKISDSINDSQRSLITTSGVETPTTHANVTRRRGQGESHDVDQMTAIQSTSQATVVQNKDVCDAFPDEPSLLIPGNINRKRSNDMVFDVLCGIEDHLFGSLGLESNLSLYKVNLQPTSIFTCTMTTSDVDLVRASCNNDVVPAPSVKNNNMYESYLEKIATYRRTGDVNRIQFSINPCIVQIRLLPLPVRKSTPKADSLEQCVAHYFTSRGLRMPTTIEGCINVCSKMFGYSNEDCRALTAVYETIISSKEIGMSSFKVNKVVRCQRSLVDFSTDGLIKVLEAFNLVYKVGFVEACYVAKEFKEHWFLTFREGEVCFSSEKPEKYRTSSRKGKRDTPQDETTHGTSSTSGLAEESQLVRSDHCNDGVKMTSPTVQQRSRISSKTVNGQPEKNKTDNCSSEDDVSQKHCHVSTETQCNANDIFSSTLSRPWITMAGEMNKNAYNTFHRSVLAYIIKYPGVQKYAIAKHFLNLIFPFAMDDILQKLEECGCIQQRVCYVKKTTLFSSKPASKKASYYLPKPDAIFKLMERVFI